MVGRAIGVIVSVANAATAIGSARRGAARQVWAGTGLAGLEVAAQVSAIGSELSSDDRLDDWLQEPHWSSQLTFGDERDQGPLRARLQAPRAIDRLRAVDGMDAQAARPLELRELGD